MGKHSSLNEMAERAAIAFQQRQSSTRFMSCGNYAVWLSILKHMAKTPLFRSKAQASFAAILIVLGIVMLAMSGCATDCSYKSDMYCVHIQ